MKDYLLKALAYNNSVRIYAVSCKDALNFIGKRFGYYPSALAAVGRTMACGIMIGSMLKLEETVTVRVDGDGPIGSIVIDANAHGEVRAFSSNPYCHFEYHDLKKLNVAMTVGTNGFIRVIKDLKLKEPFSGSTPIISGELGEDFAYYFAVSEQVPSVVSLGVLVNEENVAIEAGGFIIQLLPNTSDEVISDLENLVTTLPSMTNLLSDGITLEGITKLIDPYSRILETMDVNYQCRCSKDRFARGLLTIGPSELHEIVEEGNGAHLTCEFCREEYQFTNDEIENIYKQSITKE